MPLIITPGQLNQRAELYHSLGVMLAAGLTLPQALEQLHRSPPARSQRPAIRQLQSHLEQGHTMGDAVARMGAWMPSFDVAMVDAGERSGRLDACFKLLAAYYKDRSQMARQIIHDLLYPAFLFHFAVVLFPFLDFFKTGNLTRFLLTVFGILLPIYAAIAFVIFACQGKHGEKWRSIIEKILRPVPLLGAARRSMALARLAAALEALLNAGVVIISAWDMAVTASGSPALGRAVRAWKEPLAAGATPAELLSASPAFPELFVNLYHSGEVSGQLDETLRRLHAMYLDEGTRKMRLVTEWAPKLVYFAVMGIVAWKIISFYSGMYGPGSDLDKILKGQ